MPSPLEPILEALVAYWTSPLTLSIVAVCATSMATLLYVFLTNARNAKLRVRSVNNTDQFGEVMPEDLLNFGLIPEFIGRMPVVAPLEELDEHALIDILTRPKNALIKQYQKLLALEGCKLRFSDDALVAVSKKAINRKTGARGLRAILEDVMLNVMYDIPSQPGIRECIINADVINEGAEPLLIYEKIA